MTTLALEFPEKVFVAMRVAPKEFVKEMRLAAAVLWYEQGKISQAVDFISQRIFWMKP